MFGRIPRQRIGTIIGRTKTLIGSIDRGIRTTHQVFKAVKHLTPDSKLKAAAEKGLTDYETIREKIRSVAPPM